MPAPSSHDAGRGQRPVGKRRLSSSSDLDDARHGRLGSLPVKSQPLVSFDRAQSMTLRSCRLYSQNGQRQTFDLTVRGSCLNEEKTIFDTSEHQS